MARQKPKPMANGKNNKDIAVLQSNLDPLKMLQEANGRAQAAADAVKKTVASVIPSPVQMLQEAADRAQAAAKSVQKATGDAFRERPHSKAKHGH